MLARGDRQHDIAAHFSVNAGRIAEIASGSKFPEVKAVNVSSLPAEKSRRFIDPKAPAERQYQQLMEFVRHPPETSRILVITPELAALILERMNTGNRRKRSRNITRFAANMAASGWILTGDTIKFADTLILIDGQNRLSACVRAGVPFRTHVVFGISAEAFAAIDDGAKRTNPDTFQVAGIAHSDVVGAAVRWLAIGEGDRGQTFANRELLDFYNNNVDALMMEWAARAAKSIGKVLPKGAMAALLYQFAQKNRRVAEKFAKDLSSRSGSGRALIKKVVALRRQNLGRVHEKQINALTIQAWNALRSGKYATVANLSWDENKEYPAIA